MTEDIFQGYKGEALEVLKKYNVRVWEKLKSERPGDYSRVLCSRELRITMIFISF